MERKVNIDRKHLPHHHHRSWEGHQECKIGTSRRHDPAHCIAARHCTWARCGYLSCRSLSCCAGGTARDGAARLPLHPPFFARKFLVDDISAEPSTQTTPLSHGALRAGMSMRDSPDRFTAMASDCLHQRPRVSVSPTNHAATQVRWSCWLLSCAS